MASSTKQTKNYMSIVFSRHDRVGIMRLIEFDNHHRELIKDLVKLMTDGDEQGYVEDYIHVKIQTFNEDELDILRNCDHCFDLFVDAEMKEIDYKNIEKYIQRYSNKADKPTFTFKLYGIETSKNERFEDIGDD